MELGEKLRQARLEAGLSQKALCGEYITRNMLSQIENGSARPSMNTLRYLSSRLGKPLGFFLEELGTSPNQSRVQAARQCFDRGDWTGTLDALGDYHRPDQAFDREYQLLWTISHLKLAEGALAQHHIPHARELLEAAAGPVSYCAEELGRAYHLLLGALGEPVSQKLPSLDAELLLRAREATALGKYSRAEALLEAAEDRSSRWHLLKGELAFAQADYQRAVTELQLAEAAFPKETVPQLEAAFRELGDFERAYYYACKGRS